MPYLQIPVKRQTPGSGEEAGNIRIPCEIIRSQRRTVSLQIDRDGRVILRIPRRFPESEALRIAVSHADWILGKLEARKEESRLPELGREEAAERAKALRPVLEERVRYFAERMGVTYGRITIRSQKTRWGSCSAAGNLNFNVHLSDLEPDLMDYVIVHELAHRLEMNHSPAFWAQVARVLPDCEERRRRLRRIHL